MSSHERQHEVLQRLKDLAIRLGRPPLTHELTPDNGISRHAVQQAFGSLSVALKAAGLEATKPGPKKVTNEIFHVDIERHLEEYEPKEIPPSQPWPKIAIAGDIHEPFSHAKVKQDFKLFCAKEQPEYIVQAGDAYDFYSHASFPRSHNVFTPIEEEQSARRALVDFWKELSIACPKAKKIQLVGNHSVRPIKRVLENVPSIEHWARKYLEELLSFDGVQTVMDPREEHFIADIAFIHGHYSQLGQHRDHMLSNVVCGHTHLGGVTFRQIKNRVLWELNAGFMGDQYAKGLTYTPQKTVKWTLGWGYIDPLGPRFIPWRG